MSSKIPAENPYLPDELAQLPHGRHGLPREFVDRNHRERLIASFTALVGEVGYSGATITGVLDGAGVTSRAFYKFFETIDDCCIAAFDKGVEDLRPLLREAYLGEEEWPLRVRAVLAALLADFTGWPELARLLTVEPFVAGPELAKRHKAAIEEMVPYLREGRELRDGGEPLPDTAERGILGAVNSMIGRQVMAGRGERLETLLPDLTQFALTPFLGAAEACLIASA
ncbi:MAG: TetR/AcrR family transcriptional regulator [Solirubrobacterales bacterium]